MSPGVIGPAVALFAVTNIDDMLVLALFFGQGAGRSHTTRTIMLGQYLGFTGILAVAVAAAFGASFLPDRAVPYLGLVPLALGIRAAVQVWRHRRDGDDEAEARPGGPRVHEVAAVTFANGGDNIGVYVPVFATAGNVAMAGYVVVFLILVAVWVLAARHLAGHRLIARALGRWGHLLLPAVLIGIGLLILLPGLAGAN